MDDFTMEIKGLDELQKTLEELPLKVAKRGLRKALQNGGAQIQAGMVTLAPKDTGFMAEHFGVKIKIDRDQISGSAFIGPQGKVDYPAYASGAYNIVRNAKGAVKKVGKIAVATIVRFFEFGTSKMSKKPFMTQAAEGGRQTALDEIIAALAEAVNTK